MDILDKVLFEYVKEVVNYVKELVKFYGVIKIWGFVKVGCFFKVIVKFVQDKEVDLIVVGIKGIYSDKDGILFGSVFYWVVFNVKCFVLVV